MTTKYSIDLKHVSGKVTKLDGDDAAKLYEEVSIPDVGLIWGSLCFKGFEECLGPDGWVDMSDIAPEHFTVTEEV